MFKSSFGFLFDTEVFQLKISEETQEEIGQENAIVFNYKINQVSVQYTNYNENIFQFAINLCAILGGVFTVMKMVNEMMLKTSKILFKQTINK